jgi:hypothetical protein
MKRVDLLHHLGFPRALLQIRKYECVRKILQLGIGDGWRIEKEDADDIMGMRDFQTMSSE